MNYEYPHFGLSPEEVAYYEKMRDTVLYYNGKRFRFRYVPSIEVRCDNTITIRGEFADIDDVREQCYTYTFDYTVPVCEDLYGKWETDDNSFRDTRIERCKCYIEAENLEQAKDKFKKAHQFYKEIIKITKEELK